MKVSKENKTMKVSEVIKLIESKTGKKVFLKEEQSIDSSFKVQGQMVIFDGDDGNGSCYLFNITDIEEINNEFNITKEIKKRFKEGKTASDTPPQSYDVKYLEYEAVICGKEQKDAILSLEKIIEKELDETARYKKNLNNYLNNNWGPWEGISPESQFDIE